MKSFGKSNHSVQIVLKTIYGIFILLLISPFLFTISKTLFIDQNIFKNLSQIHLNLFLLLAKSIGLGIIIAGFSTLFGLILSLILQKTSISYSRLFKLIFLLPLLISPYIWAVAWKDFFSIFFNIRSPMIAYFGVIWVLISVFTPLSMLIISSALSNIDASIEEAGLLVSPLRNVFLKITLPLIKPAIFTSFTLVFIFSISEFSVPAFFGVRVFTTEIFTQFSAFYNYSLAILQSSFLVIICIILLYAERQQLENAPFMAINPKGNQAKKYTLPHSKTINLLLISWLIVAILIPIGVLFYQTFKEGLTHFKKAFDLLAPTFLQSISLAFLGAVLIVIIGFAAAIGRKNKYFTWMLLFVFVVPSIILGISLIQFYNQPYLDFIYSSYLIILIGYLGKFSFIASKIIENAIQQVPNSLIETAEISGIPFWKQIGKILIPLIRPSLFTAFMISFVFCLGELGTTIMVYPPGTSLMPIKIFTIMANAPQGLTSAMTLIVFLTTLLFIIIFYFLSKIIQKHPLKH